MEHAGEGHFSEYLHQEHTGIDAFKRRLQKGQEDHAIAIGTLLCVGVMDAFKRHAHSTSSPSDSTSLVFGIYHSPISDSPIRSSFHKISPNKFSLTVTQVDDWEFPAALEQAPPSNSMVFQVAVFGELLAALAELEIARKRRSPGPVAVHLEADLFTYRAMITFAEAYGLCLRLFPTSTHAQLDKHRRACDQRGPDKQTAWRGTPRSTMSGSVGDLAVESSGRNARYYLVAYCPACDKHLLPKKRLQCSQCKIAFYCNVECQKKDWKNLHKTECKKFSKLIAEADCEYCKKG